MSSSLFGTAPSGATKKYRGGVVLATNSFWSIEVKTSIDENAWFVATLEIVVGAPLGDFDACALSCCTYLHTQYLIPRVVGRNSCAIAYSCGWPRHRCWLLDYI